MKKFEIAIPVLNEEGTIENKIKELLDFIASFTYESIRLNVVIADNGSTDNTLEIVKALSKEYPILSYIHVNRPGVGLALKKTWELSDADIVGYMDLDLATDLNHIKDVCDEILCNGYDLVVGNRLAKNSEVINRSLLREITSRTFNKMVQIFVEPRVLDGMCGFKFMTKNFAMQALGALPLSNNWIFSTQVLCVAFRLKKNVKHIPLKWTDDGLSKVKLLRLAQQYIVELYRFKKELIKIG